MDVVNTTDENANGSESKRDGDVANVCTTTTTVEANAGEIQATTTQNIKTKAVLQTFQRQKGDDEESDSTQDKDTPSAKRDSRIILHYSTSKMAWDWAVLTLTAYTAVVVPMVAAFRIGPRSTAWLVVDSSFDLFFLADMAVNFHTTYVGSEGTMVTDLKRIRMKYVKTWFPIDLLSCLPYDAVTLAFGEVHEKGLAYMLSVLKACRLLRIIRIARDVDRYLEHAWATLVVLVCLILLICHWMACGWYATSLSGVIEHFKNLDKIALQELKQTYTRDNIFKPRNDFVNFDNDSVYWINIVYDYETPSSITLNDFTDDVDDTEVLTLPSKNWLLRLEETTGELYLWNSSTGKLSGGPSFRTCYTSCLYFAMTSVISAGFGNVAADTTSERIYCIFILLIGGLLYAAILGNVTNIIQQITAKEQEFLDNLKVVRNFGRLYALPAELTESICDYISFTREATHGISVDKILGYLPEHKQAEVCVFLHKDVLETQEVFKSINEDGSRILARKLQRLYLAPRDVVCDRAEEVDAIYFVMSGSLEVLQDDHLVALLERGDSFGTYFWELVSNNSQSEVLVKALTYVKLDYITADYLLNAMDSFSAIDQAFKRNCVLTYNLCFRFVFRTMEAVVWEREAAEDPVKAKKLQRLKRWRQKVMKKKQEEILADGMKERNLFGEKNRNKDSTNLPEVKRLNADQSNNGNKLSSWSGRCRAFLQAIHCSFKFSFHSNKIGDTWSKKANRDTENESLVGIEVGNLPKGELNQIKLDHKLPAKRPIIACCKRCGKPVKPVIDSNTRSELRLKRKGQEPLQKPLKSTKNNRRIKLVPLRNAKHMDLIQRPKIADGSVANTYNNSACNEILSQNASAGEISGRKNYTVGNMSAAQDKNKVTNTDHDFSEVNSTLSDILLSASCVKYVLNRSGRREWITIGEIPFTLEGKLWKELELPESTKDVLQSLLDFKTVVSQALKDLESNITRTEAVVNGVTHLVSQLTNETRQIG
ncbi:uncharacterized protein LOC143468867 isoform X3 [Clavelina lepadiformis]|uniref:uncharacterized protein LOC143468867 isoform X3 n=1 Tax=Clavelina lepadiformis TaxID=159417 RepID=UPI004043779C